MWVDGLEPVNGEEYILLRRSGGKAKQNWAILNLVSVRRTAKTKVKEESFARISTLDDSIEAVTALIGGIFLFQH